MCHRGRILHQLSWISGRNDQYFLQSFESTGHSVQEKKIKTDFQDGGDGFPTGKILAFVDLQVAPILSTKFQCKWPFSSVEKVQNRFSRWQLWRLALFSNLNYFSYFLSTSYLDTFNESSCQLAFQLRKELRIIFSRWRLWQLSWVSD